MPRFEPLESRQLLSIYTVQHYPSSFSVDQVFPQGLDFVEQLRAGRPGAADWEIGTALNTNSPDQTGQFSWQNGQEVPFWVTVSPSGKPTTVNVRFALGTQTNYVQSTYSIQAFQDFVFIPVARTQSGTTYTSLLIDDLQIEGVSIAGASAFAQSSGNQMDQMVVHMPSMMDGFSSADPLTLTGNVTMAWTGNRPTGSYVQAMMKGIGTPPKPCECECGPGLPDTEAGISRTTGDISRPENFLATASGCTTCAGGSSGGSTVAYANPSAPLDFGTGYGRLDADRPWLSRTRGPSGNLITANFGQCQTTFLQPSTADTYNPLYGTRYSLSRNATNQVFNLTAPDGTVYQFYDFAQTAYPRGGLKQITSPGGVVTTATYDAAHKSITELRETLPDGTLNSRLYDYIATGDNAGQVGVLTLRRSTDSGQTWTDLERVQYAYYGASDTNGALNDLKTATTEYAGLSGWASAGTRYYRYYSTSDGFLHGLKRELLPQAYSKAVAYAATQSKTVDELTDAEIAGYSCFTYQYNDDRRVTQQVLYAGAEQYDLVYSDSLTRTDYTRASNHWARKTVETRPDGSTYTVYSNELGQVLLSDLADSAGHHTLRYTKYDAAYRPIERYEPSAVAGYNDAAIDLDVTFTGGGLVHVTTYYTDTAGGIGAPGYVRYESVREGAAGSDVRLREYRYASHSAAGSTVYALAQEIDYLSPTETITTSYAYTYYSGTNQVQEQVTTLPAVSTGQNGSGVAATRKDDFDILGRPTWSMDERGRVSYRAYDEATGALAQSIADVDAEQLGSLVPPSGWTVPSDGLHQVTDYQHDGLGRITQVLGPAHTAVIDDEAVEVRTASWITYLDAAHQTWTASGYATQDIGGEWSVLTLFGPVSIIKRDNDGRMTDEIEALWTGSTEDFLAGDSDSIGQYVRWTTHGYSHTKLAWTRVYHTIPTSGVGDPGTNYDETDFAYETNGNAWGTVNFMGRPNKTVSPGGTITRNVLDAQGRVVSTWVGTDDTDATDSDPTGGGATGNNMVEVVGYQYDADSDLTVQTQHVGGSAADRATTFGYDWRDRLLTTLQTDGAVQTYSLNVYDNLDRVVEVQRYHDVNGDGPNTPDDVLIGDQQSSFDVLGRVYQTVEFAVNPTTGAVGNSLVSNIWYDPAGNIFKTQPAGAKTFIKTAYDGLGRVTAQYVGYDLDETTDDLYDAYGNVTLDLADDTIFQQAQHQYNAANETLLVSAFDRRHDATGTGVLDGTTARVSYSGAWFDGVGRQIATANYGTLTSAPTRPDLPPARSDTVLVTSTAFNDRGEAYSSVDPKGREDRTAFDDAGRVTATIQNYVDGDPETDGDSNGRIADEDVTVLTTYSPDGLVLTSTAVNPTTGNQVTHYVYGTTLADSDVARSDLLRAVIYPDSDDPTDLSGNGTDGVYDRVERAYNRLGQQKQVKDQNQTVHDYLFDQLGRQTADIVTLAGGSAIDDAILRIDRSYEVRGMVEKTTSFSSASGGTANIVNEVFEQYNDWGQLVREYQEHAGPVNTLTSPHVDYGYADGSQNTIRPISLTYPNSRTLTYSYNTGNDDALGRVSAIVDDDETVLVSYSYLGLGQILGVNYVEPGIANDLLHVDGSSQYDRIDRFGRVTGLVWATIGSDLVSLNYGYDRASNRTYRQDAVAGSTNNLDEVYSYDGVNQLLSMERGYLDLTGLTPVFTASGLSQSWSLDATGNWSSVTTNGTPQDRTHNAANEMTAADGWATPAYDAAGNMTVVPQPNAPANGFNLTYDAWNRVVKVTTGSGESEKLVAEYQYDGQNRRIVKKTYDSSGELAEVRHFYLSAQNQVLEEQVGASTAADRQNVWGLRYVDDLVLRDRDTDANGTLDERLYALQDANYNVVAIASASGAVMERYTYTAYGRCEIRLPDFSPTTGNASAYAWVSLYTTREFDPETGLYYYRARYYDADMGRFVGRDPAEADINLYRYCGNMPIICVDPSGLWGSADHEALTREAFLRAFSEGLDGMGIESECSRYVLGKLIAANVGQDAGSLGGLFGMPDPNSPSEQFERHFCRRPGEDPATAIHRFKDYIGTEETQFQRDVQLAGISCNCAYCDMALSALGRLSHTFQDYFGHAVDSNGVTDTVFSSGAGGTPDSPGRGVRPPTYPGEHPKWGEPAMSEAERTSRWEGAAEYVASVFAASLTTWSHTCHCCCPPPLPAQPPLVPPLPIA